MPGDKSITHRAFLLGALAAGTTTIEGASDGEDCKSTLRCLGSLGVAFESESPGPRILVHGAGSFTPSTTPLDCGNSGTTLRLLMGALAPRPGEVELSGDASLRQRPMERVARPLRLMGARIDTTNGRAPVRVFGSRLRGARLTPEAASAQIKSAILLAALSAEGPTTVFEPVATRDHTERMIRWFGGRIERSGDEIFIEGPQDLAGARVQVPGDPSSAAPFIVAALLLPDSAVTVEGVLLNPQRVRYLDVLREMGANIETEITSTEGAEPSGRIVARSSELRGVSLSPDMVPGLVDELPILAVAGAFARGRFEVRGAAELRVKESDRIAAMVGGLQSMGVDIEEREDGFVVQGGGPLRGAMVSSRGDHRIAIALSVAALGARGDTEIEGAEAVSISFPAFFAELERGARA